MKCPYTCSPFNFAFNDCVSEPGRSPEEGDVGMCYICGGWWELKDGECVKYTPTKEQLQLAMTNLLASRERAKQDAVRSGKRLI